METKIWPASMDSHVRLHVVWRSHRIFTAPFIYAELDPYADGQGITKDGRHVDQMGNQLSQFLPYSCANFLVSAAATAWLRSTEAFKNRKSSDYNIQKTFHKVTRQLSPLTLVMSCL